MSYSTYSNRHSYNRPYHCDHDGNTAWEYKLKIFDRKVYQCTKCGAISEQPLNVTIRRKVNRK